MHFVLAATVNNESEDPYPSLSDFHDYEPNLEFDDTELQATSTTCKYNTYTYTAILYTHSSPTFKSFFSSDTAARGEARPDCRLGDRLGDRLPREPGERWDYRGELRGGTRERACRRDRYVCKMRTTTILCDALKHEKKEKMNKRCVRYLPARVLSYVYVL